MNQSSPVNEGVGMAHGSVAAAGWPADGLEVLGHCPLCKETARELLHEDLEDKLFGCAPGKWTMYVCNDCGLAYLDPRPDRASIGIAYQTYSTHQEGLDDDPANTGGGRWRRAKQAVLRQYITLRFGNPRRWHDAVLGYLMYLHPRQRVAFDSALRHLPRPSMGHRLLDIGCGSGRFMAWARAAGWSCVGTEVDPVAARIARSRGFHVSEEDVSELATAGQRFNAVTISHVIEHVHDPESLLRSARELLEPGGVLWIESPNLNAHGHARFGAAWRGLEPPRHLQLFQHQSLHALLVKTGFCEIHLAPWQLDWMATFPASVHLAEMAGSVAEREFSGRKDEAVGKRHPEKREFVTLIARAPEVRS